MFGLPRFHRWRTLCTARLCAGGPMWIGERRRRRRQTFCLSMSLVTAAARCRWHNVDCCRVSCSRQRQQSPSPNRAHGHPSMDPISSLTTLVLVSRPRWLKLRASRRRYQLCAPVLTASALHPHTRHPQPFPTFARAYVRLAPAPAGTSTLFLNLPLRLLQMERRLLPSSRERHRAPYSSVLG